MNTAKQTMQSFESAVEATPVSAVMTTDVLCVKADFSVESLTALMLERGISGAPVVDDRGHPIGVVSKTDLLREAQDRASSFEMARPVARGKNGVMTDLGPGFHVEDIARATVGEIMMPVAFTLSERAPVSQAAALMAFEGVHRVPVVSSDGSVVGIVSTLDVLRWLAERSGYLRERRGAPVAE